MVMPHNSNDSLVYLCDFETGTDGWVIYNAGTLQNDNGRLKFLGTVPWSTPKKDLQLKAGSQYRVRFTIDMGNCSDLHLPIYKSDITSFETLSGVGLSITASGTYEGTFTATSNSMMMLFEMIPGANPPPDSTGYYWIDNISIEEVKPAESTLADKGGYRYGFNGKELDKETSATTTYDYGFRIYSPGLSRFLSVDPLFKSYPWYTPYQFAGNKPIAFVDIDGKEEEWYQEMVNPVNIWNSAVDGLGNILLRIGEWEVTDNYEGGAIRTVMLRYGMTIPPNITNKDLGKNFQLYKEDRTFKVRTEQGVLNDLKDVAIGALDVAAVIPSKGGGAWLAAKTTGITAHSISEILKGLSINKRIEKFRSAIDFGADATGKTLMRETEAQTAGILDDALGGVRALKQGESAGDVIGLSGKYANKSIDIMNPSEAVAKGKLNMTDFLSSVDEHLGKADFTAIDMRKMAGEQIDAVEQHISSMSDANRAKIITIK